MSQKDPVVEGQNGVSELSLGVFAYQKILDWTLVYMSSNNYEWYR
jgi:hypothetical protein